MLDTIVFYGPLAFQVIHNLLFDKKDQNQSYTIYSLQWNNCMAQKWTSFPPVEIEESKWKTALTCEDCVIDQFLSSYSVTCYKTDA